MCLQSLPTVLSSFQNLLHLISVWKEGRGRIWWQFQLERVKKLLVGTNIKARTWKRLDIPNKFDIDIFAF